MTKSCSSRGGYIDVVRAQRLLTQTENQTRRRMMDVRASHVVAGPSPSLRIECSIEGIEVASRLLEVTQIFRAQLAIQPVVAEDAQGETH